MKLTRHGFDKEMQASPTSPRANPRPSTTATKQPGLTSNVAVVVPKPPPVDVDVFREVLRLVWPDLVDPARDLGPDSPPDQPTDDDMLNNQLIFSKKKNINLSANGLVHFCNFVQNDVLSIN